MTAAAVGRVVAIAVLLALLALLGATTGLAAAWAVPIGVAISLLGAPPVAPRAATALGGALLGLVGLLTTAAVGGSLAVASAVSVGLLAVGAGLLALRDGPMAPSWAVLVGGATVLGGAQVAGEVGVVHVAPAVGGLIVGLLPMQAAEVAGQVQRRRRERRDQQEHERDRSRDRDAGVTAVLLLALLAAGSLIAPTAALADADDDDRGGTVEVDTRPRSTESVEVRLAPDGEVVDALLRRHERDTGEGLREHTGEVDEARLPVAVSIRYEVDGAPVSAEELRGATGEAAVRIQLRNPTLEPRPVTPAGGGGEVEVDLSLPIVADTAVELDGAWQDVWVDTGRLAPAADGGSHVRWSSALIEPFAATTTEIEIRGHVEDATLPRVEVDARPVDAATSDLLQVLRDQIHDDSVADAVAAFIADSLGDGLAGAAEGADGLAEGLAQARQGAGEIGAALAQLQEEMGEGLAELEEGLAQLDQGLAAIAAALAEVEDGLGQVSGGIRDLGDGVAQAQDGAQMLRDEIAGPSEDAVRAAWAALAEDFTIGMIDPAYVEAVASVGELHALLTGELPPLEGLEEPPEELLELIEAFEQLEQLGEALEQLQQLGEVLQGLAELGERLEEDIAAPELPDWLDTWGDDLDCDRLEGLEDRVDLEELELPEVADLVAACERLRALDPSELLEEWFELDGLGDLEELAGLGELGDLDGLEGLEGLDALERLGDLLAPDGEAGDLDDLGDLDGAGAALDDYPGLATTLDELAGGLGEAAGGADELAGAVDGITVGLTEIRSGLQDMRQLMSQEDAGLGAAGDPDEMAGGLDEFEDALAQLAGGGDDLADGLRALGEGSDELVERLERELAAANLDLGTIDALSERASEVVDTDEADAIGGHDRYLLVMHETETSATPIVALGALGLLGVGLELLRRRLSVA